tara:strand:+ start:3009 stop:3362 length:354 start_codon:yes stop_codon:yes gene_type:complete
MTEENKNINNDYNYSRETYYELLEKGKSSLDDMMDVARASEHPRAYEVLATMIKNLSDVNDKLMDLNKKRNDMDKRDEDVKQITNNNVFLGSTADLQRMLNQEEEVIDVTPEGNVSG